MTATTDTQPEDLRNRMVEHIDAAGHLHSASVERALRTVPRHLFVPDASIEDAYANKAITTKSGGPGGRPASCASVPTVVAMMLGQLDAHRATASWRSVPVPVIMPRCWPNSSATPAG